MEAIEHGSGLHETTLVIPYLHQVSQYVLQCVLQCVCDVKVFNPFAKSNQRFSLAACFSHHEKSKKRAYEQRIIEVEHGSFTPLVFSTTGGMGRQSTIFYSRLASLLARKRHQPYSTTMGWLRCHLSFLLLRSSILCIRGSRSSRHVIPRFPAATDLAVSESMVN